MCIRDSAITEESFRQGSKRRLLVAERQPRVYFPLLGSQLGIIDLAAAAAGQLRQAQEFGRDHPLGQKSLQALSLIHISGQVAGDEFGSEDGSQPRAVALGGEDEVHRLG